MSTVQATNLKSAASASNNIVLDASGNTTFAGTAAMASSFLRNRIINGGMDIWQRGTSTSTSGAYLADRWIVAAGSTITGSQSSDVPSGFKFSLSLNGTNNPQTLQRIESVNCFDLVGQNVTVSFWAKQTTGAGANSLSLIIYSANALDNFGAVTSIGTQSFTGSTSWTRYTATFNSLPAAVANGLQVLIYANTAGAATFLVTGVQLEVGTVATPFERRQYGQELALCQRYYEAISFGANITIGSASVGTSFSPPNAQGLYFPFKATKRASASMSSTSASSFNVAGIAATSISLSADTFGATIFSLPAGGGSTGSSWTSVYVAAGASGASLFASSEL